MEGSLNVDNFDKSLLFSISFSMEGSLSSNLQLFTLKFSLINLCIVEAGERVVPQKAIGRFPFDQIYRFEIPGISCDEWNSIFRCVGLTNPRSSGSKFRAKIRDQTEDSFIFAFLLWGCSTTLKLK